MADWPPKFTLDASNILKLLTGDRFYSSADACLREAVLNAIDACGRRRTAAPGHLPTISVRFDDQARTVTIADNGDGMGRSELTDLFAKVGASASRLTEKVVGQQQYSSVGEFGIGIVSYFLVSSRFVVHTAKPGQEPLRLEFDRAMLDTVTSARELPPESREIGTTITLFVEAEDRYKLLVEKYAHWFRSVDGLGATRTPGDRVLPQGGDRRLIRRVEVSRPDWIERAAIGIPSDVAAWPSLDGSAHVEVLYRGVFVQRLQLGSLWPITGSLHVDPKKFKPSLNRESFIAEGFEEEIARYLQSIHPQVLLEALTEVRQSLDDERVSDWTIHKWVSLWLAIPRGGRYIDAAKAWDEEFRRRPAFHRLGPPGESGTAEERGLSLAELSAMKGREVFLAPVGESNDIVKRAVRVLRAKGLPVIRGIAREKNFLGGASFSATTSAELILSHFQQDLPKITCVEEIAERVVTDEVTVDVIYGGSARVLAMRLGGEAAPLVRVGNDLWLNIDAQIGKRLLLALCDRNEGRVGLLVACQLESPAHIGEVSHHLRHTGALQPERLGLVKRRFLRRLAV